jgi:hypothetical protein
MVERTDIELSTDLGTRLDDTGDFDTVTAEQTTVEQRAVMRVLNVSVPWRGNRLTNAKVEDLRELLERRLSNDDVIDVPVSVDVSSIEGNEVTYLATVGANSFEVTRE